MNQTTTANKVSLWNNVTRIEEVEVCNDERLAQLRAMPFIRVQKLEKVQREGDNVAGLGGVTPAFKRWWDAL